MQHSTQGASMAENGESELITGPSFLQDLRSLSNSGMMRFLSFDDLSSWHDEDKDIMSEGDIAEMSAAKRETDGRR